MELQTKFDRRVGGAGTTPVLGTDAVPTGLPVIGSVIDNLGTIIRTVNSVVSEQPVQRIWLFHHYAGAGPAVPVPVDVYAYVRDTNGWVHLGAQALLTTDNAGYVDLPALVKTTGSGSSLQDQSANSLEVVIIATSPVGAPDGTYTFGAAFDVSMSPGDEAIAAAAMLGELVAIHGHVASIDDCMGTPGPTGPSGAVQIGGTDGSAGLVKVSTSDLPSDVGDHVGLDVATCPKPGNAWATLRTFAATVADTINLTTLETVTGIVDLSGLAYPAALTGKSLTINGQTCLFAAGHPVDLADALVHLNAAITDCTFTAPGPGFVLVVVKDTPGNLTISGTAVATLGLTAATTGPWIPIPTYSSAKPGAVAVELGFVPGFSVTNNPQQVILHLWRMNANYGGTAEICGEIRIDAADIADQASRRFYFDGTCAYLTVEFVGGAVPTITGVVRIRGVYAVEGSDPLQSAILKALSSALIPEGNYSTAMGDGTAVRLADTQITLTPITHTPVTTQLRKVLVDTGTAVNIYEQSRGAIRLSIAAGVITIGGAGAAPVPAGSVVEVRWTGPDKGLGIEDAASASGDILTMQGRVRRDAMVCSAGSDGDKATANQDPDGYDPVVDKCRDSAANANRVERVNPDLTYRGGPTSLIAAAQTITNSWLDLGPEYPVDGQKWIALVVSVDINTCVNVRFRALIKTTNGGTTEAPIPCSIVDSSATPYLVKYEGEVWEYNVDGTDFASPFEWSLGNCVQWVQFQVMAENIPGAAGSVLTAECSTGY